MRYHNATRAGRTGRREGGVYRRALEVGQGDGFRGWRAGGRGGGGGLRRGRRRRRWRGRPGRRGGCWGRLRGPGEAEELVLDGAVVEVEAAGAEEDAGKGDAGWVGSGAAAFDQLDEADDQDGGAEEVEEAVGDEAGGEGRAVVEVVPGEELVEDDLVEGAGEADADQDAWPEQGRAAGARRRQVHHLLGGRVPRQPGVETGPVSGGWPGG